MNEPLEEPEDQIVPLGQFQAMLAPYSMTDALLDVANQVVIRQELPPSSPRSRNDKRDRLEIYKIREAQRRKRVDQTLKDVNM